MGTTPSKVRSLIRRAANAYSAGPAVHDAQTVCERLAGKGMSSAVCYWNIDSDRPQRVFESCVDILDLISGLGSDCYLSVKAPALRFDFALLEKILERARDLDATVHFDSMSHETVDPTFDLIEQARQSHVKLGCTLPGRWRRSLTDADRAIAMKLRVRVVKGEWPDPNGEAEDPGNGFLNIVDRLAAGRARHVAVATHNVQVARLALSRLRTTGTSCELELLYGRPLRPMLLLAHELKVPVRMYVPYGRAGLPYRLKQAKRSPRILGWFVRDLIRGGVWGQAG